MTPSAHDREETTVTTAKPPTTQKLHSVLRRAGLRASPYCFGSSGQGYRVQDQRGLKRLVVTYHDIRFGDTDGFPERRRAALKSYVAALRAAGIACTIELGVVVVTDYAPAKQRRRRGGA